MYTCKVAVCSVVLINGLAIAEPVDIISAATLSWTSDNPIVQASQDRIPLDDTGNNGWYIAPNYGINLLSDFNNASLEIAYDTGTGFGFSIGKEVNPGFRMQLDIGQMKNDLESVFVNIGPGVDVDVNGAEITQTPIILNAIWEPRSHDRLFPYIGVGVGAIRGDYSVEGLPPEFSNILDIDWGYAIQVRAGIKIELSHSSAFNLGYQYLHAGYGSDLDLNNNLITIGLEFRF